MKCCRSSRPRCAARHAVVLVAPPGAGKTTRVPLVLAGEAMGERQEDHRAGAAPARRACGGFPHGGNAGRAGRRDGRLSGALRRESVARNTYRAGHRGRVHPHGAGRSGARRHRRGGVRRVPRTLARCRPRPGARPRRADRPARRPQASRHVGDDRRRARGKASGRCAGDRKQGPRLPGRDPLPRARCADAGRAPGGGCGRAGFARRGGIGAGVPSGRRRDQPSRSDVVASASPILPSISSRSMARSTPICRTAPSRRRRRAGARSCSPPRSPKPRSRSRACASWSMAGSRACRATSPTWASRGSTPCASLARPPISAEAVPGAPSPASATGCGTSRRRHRLLRPILRKSSPPTSPA